MPQAPPELSARWPGSADAMKYLEDQGFKLTNKWYWIPPKSRDEIIGKEWDAINYLILEWDFGGLEEDGAGVYYP